MQTLTPPTLGDLFDHADRKFGESAAYIQFDQKIRQWRTWSWTEMRRYATQCQQWLARLELDLGSRVLIMAPNSTTWVAMDVAAAGLGLVTVPVYVQESEKNLLHILRQVQAQVLLVGGVEQWQLVKPCFDHLVADEKIAHCVSVNPVVSPQVRLLADCIAPFAETDADYTNCVDDDTVLATIVYTSGTTGFPKGVMLSHKNILSNVVAATAAVPIGKEDRLLSFLPLSHSFERTVGYYAPMLHGSVVIYNRAIAKIRDDLKTIRPTVLVSVPRIYERIYARVHARFASRPLVKHGLNLTVSIGWRYFLYRQKRGAWRLSLLLRPMLDLLIARRVRAEFGGRLRFTISGGAPLAAEISHFFISLGIFVLQGYGMTETAPVIAVNRLDRNIPESVGIPLDKLEVCLSEDNELLVRGENVMLGYWKNDVASRYAFAGQGWLRTGDIGQFKDKHLFITGRLKEIIVLATGKKFSPAEPEAAILFSPLFDQVILCGEQRPFPVVIAVVNSAQWQKHAEKNAYDLAGHAARNFAAREINRYLQDFPHYVQVHGVILTEEPWTTDNGLLTATLKLRRAAIQAHYRDEINAIYATR